MSRRHITPSFIGLLSWFERVTGVTEREWMARRGELLDEGAALDDNPRLGPRLFVVNARTGKRHDAGAFSVWPIRDLRAACVATDARAPRVQVRVRTSHAALRHVEASYLQAHAHELPGASSRRALVAFQGVVCCGDAAAFGPSCDVFLCVCVAVRSCLELQLSVLCLCVALRSCLELQLSGGRQRRRRA